MGKYYKYKNLEENRFQEFDKSDILSGPLHIAIDITNKCNAKCLHCFNRSGNGLLRNEISDREMLEIFKEIAVIKPFSTCFCGGEPMMKYDLVLRATEVLKNGGVPNIAMVTNGWFLTKDRVISLRNAGLTHIQLSLDGKDAKTHERMRGINGIYEKVLDALNFIDDAGISSAVAFSPTQFNIKQFPEVVELLQKFENLREIKVQPLMPLGKAVEGKSELFASEEEYRELVAYIERFNAKRDYNNKFRIDWSDPLDHLRRFTTLNFKNNIFLHIFLILLVITGCTGWYSFLLVLSIESHTASAYIPVTVGNLKRHSLKDYWKAGLGKVWDIPVIRELAEFVVCIEDMKYDLQERPKIFYEDNIEIDLVDDDIMHHLEEFTLEKLYK